MSIEAGKLHALDSHLVDVWCADIGRTETTEVLVTEVICEDDDEVRLLDIGKGRTNERE